MPPESDTGQPTGPGSAHRPASVTLRTGARAEEGSQLDPANQSLAEALSLVFKILQFAMLVLFAAFAFSGFSSVNENEKGIRLLFGRQTGRDLLPGPYFSAPLPLGELVKVDTGQVALEIDDTFWPKLTDEQRKLPIQELAKQGTPSLKPGQDGSLLTADANLAHALWSVRYRRDSAFNWAQNVLPEDERAIVRAAVERGIVHAVAQVSIDDLLKQSSSDQGSVATRARELAQESLDSINSGIKIDQLTLKDKAPPFSVYGAFSSVQSAVQTAGAAREKAQTDARNILSSAAGEAHEPLIRQIDLYEQAIARADEPAQRTILSDIHALFDGRETKIGERTYRARLISGQVTNVLNDARQYQSTVVSQRQGELASFQAKLAQFKANPNVVIQREWADAMTVFLNKPLVEIFNLPPGMIVDLWINRDPDFVKKAAEEIRRKKALEAEEQRRIEQAREFYRTRTDTQTVRDR